LALSVDRATSVATLLLALVGCREREQAQPSPQPSASAQTAARATPTPTPSPQPSAPPTRAAEHAQARRGGGAWVLDGRSQRWDKHCSIHRACKLQERPLEPCAPGATAPDWESYSSTLDDGDQFVDPHRAFSGRLWLQDGVFSTAVSCQKDVCCNGVRRDFMVGESPRALVLEGAGIGCVGDESRQCCAFPAKGQRVIVSGNLNNTIPLRSARAVDRWRLLDAKICLLPAP